MSEKPGYEELAPRARELEEEGPDDFPGDSDLQEEGAPAFTFTDVFDIDGLQEVQDAFADSAGVSCVITDAEGRFITRPSNFCRACADMIRNTRQGAALCRRFYAAIGRRDPDGPAVRPCLTAGFWNVGVGIMMGDRRVANWVVGQVLLEGQDQEKMMRRARAIGVDEAGFRAALTEVTVMPREKFERIGKALFHMANQMSKMAWRDFRLNRFSRRIGDGPRGADRKLASIVKSMPYIVYRLDADSRISFISDAVRGWGYSPGELIGRGIQDIIHPEDRARVERRINERRTGSRATRDLEVRVLRKDRILAEGEATDEAVDSDVLLIVDAEGLYTTRTPARNAFEGTRGVARVITERKRAEEALKKSEERLRNIAANVPGVVFQFYSRPEEGYGFYYVNERVKEIVGIDNNLEGLFERFTDRVDRRDRERFLASIKAAVDNVEPWEFEGRFHGPSDETVWFKGLATSSRQEEEVTLDGLILDVTDRVLAEEKLRDSKERLSLALDVSNARAWELDLDAGEFFLDDESYGFVDFDKETPEKTPEALNAICHPDDLPAIKADLAACLAGEAPALDNEFRLKNKNGQWRWFHSRAKVVKWDADRKPATLIGTSSDITARKETEKEKEIIEDQLRQSEKMQAIGALAGGVAHDFNNLLSVIIGQAEMIEMFDAEENEELQGRVKELRTAANRARDLVNQILTFSRRAEYKKEKITLHPIIEEVTRFLRASIPSTIEIRECIQIGEKTILADPVQIHQVLMNLCTNAAHAMWEKGGKLEITLDEVAMDDENVKKYDGLERGPHISLSVRDTGRGIDQSLLKKLFDPY
ncbi:MAG: PAS domain-containing protein, partial [Desulfobacterales bacterium]|nr:PAS domain-containing protein [Desulfobacterales bacterium]